jgi:hypothetical protein
MICKYEYTNYHIATTGCNEPLTKEHWENELHLYLDRHPLYRSSRHTDAGICSIHQENNDQNRKIAQETNLMMPHGSQT